MYAPAPRIRSCSRFVSLSLNRNTCKRVLTTSSGCTTMAETKPPDKPARAFRQRSFLPDAGRGKPGSGLFSADMCSDEASLGPTWKMRQKFVHRNRFSLSLVCRQEEHHGPQRFSNIGVITPSNTHQFAGRVKDDARKWKEAHAVGFAPQLARSQEQRAGQVERPDPGAKLDRRCDDEQHHILVGRGGGTRASLART